MKQATDYDWSKIAVPTTDILLEVLLEMEFQSKEGGASKTPPSSSLDNAYKSKHQGSAS